MKAALSILSLIIGVIGVGVFFNPVVEIICGVGGLIISIIAKDPKSSRVIRIVRYFGNSLAWLNIFWVCLEFGLKFAGINLFE